MSSICHQSGLVGNLAYLVAGCAEVVVSLIPVKQDFYSGVRSGKRENMMSKSNATIS